MTGGHRVQIERCRRLGTLVLAATGLTPVAQAQIASAGVAAKVVTPTELDTAATIGWLISEAPGAFTLRIPGAASAATIDLTAQAEGGIGAITLSGSGPSIDVWRRAIVQFAMSGQNSVSVHRTSSTADDGTIYSRGMQLVITQVAGDDSRHVLAAIITFD